MWGVVAERRENDGEASGGDGGMVNRGLLTIEDDFARTIGYQHLHVPPGQPHNRTVNEQWRLS